MGQPRIAFLILMILALFAAGGAAAQEKLRFAVGEWAPYFSEKAPGHGSYARVMTRAFALEGIAVEYGFFPWKRALVLARDGSWDGSAGWARTEERAPFFHFCDPVLIQRELPFYHTDRPLALARLEEADGEAFGALLGAALGERLDRLVAEGRLTVFRAKTLEELVRMLAAGRVDFILGNEVVARAAVTAVIASDQRHKFQPREDLAVTWDYRVILSRRLPDGADLCARFNRGLERVRDSGDYERIMLGQGVTD